MRGITFNFMVWSIVDSTEYLCAQPNEFHSFTSFIKHLAETFHDRRLDACLAVKFP